MNLILLLLTLSGAQTTHPCDAQAVNTSVSTAGTYSVQFCALASDKFESITVYVNGAAFVGSDGSNKRPFTLAAAPNAAGFALYESAQELRFRNGTNILEVSIWTRPVAGGPLQESARSSPFSFGAVDDSKPATAPRITGVKK